MIIRNYIAILSIFLYIMSAPLPTHGINPCNIENIGVGHGLSTNYVTCIQQDKNGFLWIGSDAGLHRFDGYSFTHYSSAVPGQADYSATTPGLAGNSISSLLYDEETDRLWIGTKSGLSRLNCATGIFEKISYPGKAYTYNISQIIKASDGGVWVINHHHSIIHVSEEGETTLYSAETIPRLKHTFTTACEDNNGNLIIGILDSGISVLDIKENSVTNYNFNPAEPNGIPGAQIHSIMMDSHKNIWLTSNHGLSLFMPDRGRFITFRHNPDNPNSIASDHVFALHEDNDGMIWVGCDMGNISVFNPSDLITGVADDLKFNNFNVRRDNRLYPNSNIRAIYKDRYDNIWIANYGSGLEFISSEEQDFKSLPHFNSGNTPVDNRVLWSVYTDGNGDVWAGAMNSIGVYSDGKLKKTIALTPDLTHPYARITAIGTAGDDMLFGIYDDGILRMNKNSEKLERVNMKFQDVGINIFFNDITGNTLVGASNGLWIYKDGQMNFMKDADRILGGLSVTGIVRDKNDRLWIGTFGNGVFVFDKNFKRASHIKTALKGGAAVKALFKDSKGRIWILTREGVNLIKRPEENFNISSPAFNPSGEALINRAITEDSLGMIWITTDNELLSCSQGNDTFKRYNSKSGMRHSNFNDRAASLGFDGKLYFGSGDGVCTFNALKVQQSKKCAEVRIVECRSHDGQSTDISGAEAGTVPQKKEFSHDDSSIKISYTVPDYAQSRFMEYAVMMEGLDADWSIPTHQNYVQYRNLPPGKYVFKVKARLPNQEWDGTNYASLGISITPPIWNTWWAYLFYAAVVVFLIYLWLKFYKKRVSLRSAMEVEHKKNQNEKELNNERLRFYTNITHELRTPLTLILGPLEDLLTDDSLPAPFKAKIKIIHGSALRLLNLINQILEFRKTETQNRKLSVSKRNLKNLVMEIGLRYKELNRNKFVSFNIDIEPGDYTVYFDTEIVTTILNNLLSNAMKYTPEGSITLSLKTITDHDERFVEISVADTGYGIAAEALPHIFERYYQAKGKHQASGTGIGLALTKSLTELHNGFITVESKLSEGTVFRFRILADNTYPDALHSDSESTETQEEDDCLCEETDDTRDLVLVVEDNPEIRDYITNSLSDKFRVVQASNGKEGLDEALKNNPSIIVTDLMMPVMDGIDLLKKVKSDIRTSHIPVILLTAKDSLQDKERGYDLGADSYLTKPFSAKLLKSRIHNILSTRRQITSMLTSKPSKSNNNEQEAAHEENTSAISLSKFDREFLQKLSAIVEENIAVQGFDMSLMQEKLNMSRSTLYRKIKGLTGLSGNEFIRKARLRHVAEKLEEGCNVSDAAYESGFNDLGYFRGCFKEEYGVSPSQYARTHNKSRSE